MEKEELVALAIQARRQAYAVYSGFRVGAALLTKEGKVYLGCNIENAAYTPSNCAERTAFFKAVSEGERAFAAIAIVGGKEDDKLEYCAPCGVCRQVMREFCEEDTFEIILGSTQGPPKCFKLAELFPESFGPQNLENV